MSEMQDVACESVHFIGIGGVGMSGIARVAHDQGLRVSGSDIKESRYTLQLKEAGIEVKIGSHSAANIPGTSAEDGPDVVVVTTAVLDNNPELIAAEKRGLTIWHRAQMLARLGEGLQTVAIAGTHGKTTVSSMVATALDGLGTDPTFLIGGIVRAYGTNAHSGTGAYYVVEADESDKSFRYLAPAAVLVTNVEADHLDHYRDLKEINEKFASFITSTAPEGPIVVCGEDANLMQIVREIERPFITYGFARALRDDEAHSLSEADTFDVEVVDYQRDGIASSFTLRMPDGRLVEGGLPASPGRHNVLNAAGALALIDALGLSAQQAADALKHFEGAKRRFELVGQARGVTVVDDYAHHPTEIAATLAAAKGLGYEHVHVLFQPHRYSRVPLFCEVLHDEFGRAFDDADTVTFMDVYSAGETPVPGVSGKTFMQPVLDHEGHPYVRYVARRIDVISAMVEIAQPGDLVITMGAGDVTAMGGQLLEALEGEAQ